MGGSPFCVLLPVQSVFEWGEADNPHPVKKQLRKIRRFF